MKTRARRRAPSFTAWFESERNPLKHASHLARHFAADALKAAFEAGEAHERTKDADLNEDIFGE